MKDEKREEMELSIDDPAFALMRIQLDGEIIRAIDQMDEKNVDEATVTMKIVITREEVSIPNREPAIKLSMGYKINRQIVMKEHADGSVTELNQFEVEYDSRGKMSLHRLRDPQHSIDEYM